MYPIKFSPILKYRIWGGCAIFDKLSRENSDHLSSIGESWDISDREDSMSIVENGSLKGLSIKNLREKFGHKLFGTNIDISQPFPLLVKILDAREDLSLQVHPKKSDLSKLPVNSYSKTEFWYILDNDENACIMAGLNKKNLGNKNTENIFIENLQSSNLKNFVNIYQTKKDMLIYIESGTIHAIGNGNLILEIQENSDTTYRVSDWGRLDLSTGKPRDLHITESLISIDFESNDDAKISNINLLETTEILDSEYFYTKNHYLRDNDNMLITTPTTHCYVLSVTNGCLHIDCNDISITLKKGDNVLLPAGLNFYVKNSNQSSFATFLTTKPKK